MLLVSAYLIPFDHPCHTQAKSQFKSRSIANNVDIIIPVPSDVDSPSFKASIGTVTYLPDKVSQASK